MKLEECPDCESVEHLDIKSWYDSWTATEDYFVRCKRHALMRGNTCKTERGAQMSWNYYRRKERKAPNET